MKITDICKNKKQTVSFEIFPPKGDMDIESFRPIIEELKTLAPDYISVTYSAGGTGNSNKTIDVASIIKNEYKVEAVAHLTCVNSKKDEIQEVIAEMKKNNIENILALRGDRRPGCDCNDFSYARELIELLQNEDFCIGAGCYPEGHIECESFDADLARMYEKQQAGVDFFVSQLFFDNSYFYRFLEKARKIGITKPIDAGVMPMLSKAQVSRMIFMCGASLPSQIIKILYKYENNADDLKKAGIEYAAKQLDDLLKNGVDGIHIYTMNQPQIAKTQLEYIKNNKG